MSTKKRDILTVIPIRSGSKGIKNKNITLLAGKPLVAHVIEAARKSSGVGKIIVSTDSREYASIANQWGAETPFIRPESLSHSSVRLHHVVKHALYYCNDNGYKFDAVLSLQATAPLITPATIDKVIDKFHRFGCQSVGTASVIRHGHPYLAKKSVGIDNDIMVDYIELEEGSARYPRQARPELYYFNGAMFIREKSLLDEMNESTNCLGSQPRSVLISDEEAVNIDDALDMKIAECLMLRRKKHGKKYDN